MELDRGYVVNGDDLRIALASPAGKPFLVGSARDMAEQILGQIGQPLDEHRAFITQPQLAGLLERFRLTVIDSQGGSPVNGEVDDPRAVAGEIFAAHAASLARREPQPDSDPLRTVKRVLAWATDYLADFDNPPF